MVEQEMEGNERKWKNSGWSAQAVLLKQLSLSSL